MQEWYLINNSTKPNVIGGYENLGFLDNKDDAFSESLTTDIADDIFLYNHDLSESIQLRGIIQGNTADTSLKSMERSLLVPIGTLHSGDYIYFEDEYWIVDGRPGNNKIYEKAILKECQYKLRWQKDNGEIIDRWVNLTSASKYDVGETGNNIIMLTSNNYTIVIPYDEDSITLDGKRVFIDMSPNPKKVFKITRNDDVLFIHGKHGGTLSLIADKTELNTAVDRPDLRLCDYITTNTTPLLPLDETTVLKANINGNQNLKVGFSRTYTVTFANLDGNNIDWNNVNFTWEVISDFDVKQEINNNKIQLSVNDDSLIGESFLLQIKLQDDNSIVAKLEIFIVEGW